MLTIRECWPVIQHNATSIKPTRTDWRGNNLLHENVPDRCSSLVLEWRSIVLKLSYPPCSLVAFLSNPVSWDITSWKHNYIILTSLTFTTLWAFSADDKLMIFFLFFPENRIRHFIKETICMKCHILFSGKNKKNISKCCLLKILPRVLSVKPHFYIVKLGFTGVYIIFPISAQKHRLWVLIRAASARRF